MVKQKVSSPFNLRESEGEYLERSSEHNHSGEEAGFSHNGDTDTS